MDGHVLVALLVTAILGHKVQIVPTDDDGPHHFVLDHHAGQNSTTDGHIAGERTLLVNVCAIDGLRLKKNKKNNLNCHLKTQYLSMKIVFLSSLTSYSILVKML